MNVTARFHSVSIALNRISSKCRIIVSDQIYNICVCASRTTRACGTWLLLGAHCDPEVGRSRPWTGTENESDAPSTQVLSLFHASTSLSRRNVAVAQSRKHADRIFIELSSHIRVIEGESGSQTFTEGSHTEMDLVKTVSFFTFLLTAGSTVIRVNEMILIKQKTREIV